MPNSGLLGRWSSYSSVPVTFVCLLAVIGLALCTSAFAADGDSAPTFPDVPKDHWAAPAVEKVAADGVMKGYPDGKFKGDQPLTRYELAVALARFAEFIEGSRKPLIPAGKKEESKVDCPSWAKSSVELLTLGQFLPKTSPIICDGAKPATAEDLAQALASLSTRIVELDNAEDEVPKTP